MYEFAPIDVSLPMTEDSFISSIGALRDQNDALFSSQSFMHANLGVKDLIGRSIVLSSSRDTVDKDSLCGVIARSAGAWENDKSICSCSGKNVWQERQDAIRKGITS